MIATQNFKRVYSARNIKITYKNYKKHNRPLYYQVIFFALYLHIAPYRECLFITKNQITKLTLREKYSNTELFPVLIFLY